MARIGLNALVMYTGATFRNAGVSRYASGLIDALLQAPSDHQFQIYLNDSVETLPFEQPASLRVTRSRLPTARTSVRVLWEQLAAPWHVVRDRPDVLHSFLNVAPLAAPVRHVVTVHDLSFLRVPEAHPARRRWYLHAATRLSVRRAAGVLADSEATKADLIEAFGVKPDKVTVVYPGVDPAFHPRPDGALAEFRATHAVRRPFVLFVGTIEPRKNVDTLVRAYARVRRDGAFDGELVIAGGAGWDAGATVRAIAESGFAGDIRQLGYVNQTELPFWYTAANLVVYPSSYEGFGIPVLEAMASGTPVITSDRSSLPEVVGGAGLTVDPRDHEQMAAAMAEVLSSSARQTELRRLGLAQAERFRWTDSAQRCLSVYQRVLTRA